MKLTACVTCWAIIDVPDDYSDLIHKGVCSDKCAQFERNFTAHHTARLYWAYMQHHHGVNRSEKEKLVPRRRHDK